MNFLLGKHSFYKTTLLLQIGYDLLYSYDSDDNYVLMITASNSKDIKDLLMGKYNTVSADIIENIQIKVLSSYNDLENFLLTLLLLDQKNFPLIILIDRINLLIGIQRVNFKEEGFSIKLFEVYSHFLDIVDILIKKKKLKFFISMDISLDKEDSMNNSIYSTKDEMILINLFLAKSANLYNIIEIKEEERVQCFKIKFTFDVESPCLFKYENSIIEIKHNKRYSNCDFNEKIDMTLNKFKDLVNDYLNQNNSKSSEN